MAHRRLLSFKYASSGVLIALREQPNIIIHFIIAALTLIFGFYLNLPALHMGLLIIAIGLVISLELANTAIEEIVDSFTSEVHPGAKKAKDIAAGAVLVASVTALSVGLIIFLPYL